MVQLHPLQERIIKNIKPDIDYSYQKLISYSQYSTWKSCPYKWYLQYIEKKGTPSSINMTFGTAIHETIQEYLKIMYSESGKAADQFDYESFFQESFINAYKKDIESNNGVHFSSPVEMKEFYDDGINILEFLTENRRSYFDIKNVKLLGIEIPLVIKPNINYPNLFYKGYLDIVLYDETSEEITIIDLKTSTKGWGEYHKKDATKISQLLLYKDFFSKQYNFPIDKINVKFIILKRKIWEEALYPAAKKRMQEFVPANGKSKVSKTIIDFNNFINECFEIDGTFKTNITHIKIPTEYGCKYCPFNEVCDKKN